MIHPTAIINPKAILAPDVVVGPFCVIDEAVRIGEGCWLGPHVHITGRTTIGARNRFHAGAVIGDAPQDLRYNGAPTGVRIGDDNTFREYVTVHRSNKVEEDTVIGSHNFLMATCHVGHNSAIGDHVIIANGSLLGGHAIVEDRVFISATAMIHQFARLGRLSFMQGGSGVSQDLPPFTIATGNNTICGLNIIGMRRAGLTSAERLELKKVYHALFRSGRSMRDAVAEARARFTSAPAVEIFDFVERSKRGVCTDISREDAAEDTIEA